MDITSVFRQLSSSQIQHHHHHHTTNNNVYLREAYSILGQTLNLKNYLDSIRPTYLARTRVSRQIKSATTASLSTSERQMVDEHAEALLHNLSSSITMLGQRVKAHYLTVYPTKPSSKHDQILRLFGLTDESSPLNTDQSSQLSLKTLTLMWDEILAYLRRELRSAGLKHARMLSVWEERQRLRSNYASSPSNIPLFTKHESKHNIKANIASPNNHDDDDDAELSALQREISPKMLQQIRAEEDFIVQQAQNDLARLRDTQMSIYTISTLQSRLAAEIASQSDHITTLHEDALSTVHNVVNANKQLLKASQRTSSAAILFWATCTLCASLIIWDMIF